MTEREKIAQLLCKQTGSNENRECESCPFNGCIAQRQADALITAGIGDVTEYKETIRDLNTDVVAYRALSKADTLEQIIEGQKSLIDEYKHRAEVAERALSWLCDETMRDIRIIMYPTIGKQVRDKQELYDYCIEQAERGELVEAPKGSVVLTPEERKQAVKVFAERVKMAFYYEFDELIPSIMADKIDELVKEVCGE